MGEKTDKSPYDLIPTRWFFHDRSDEPYNDQVIDILIDIRNILFLMFIFMFFT